jgi:hypothetical protein
MKRYGFQAIAIAVLSALLAIVVGLLRECLYICTIC